MFYKTGNIMKYSFLAAGLAYLLSSTALAQNLSLLDDEAPAAVNVDINIDEDAEHDELGLAKNDAPAEEEDTLSPAAVPAGGKLITPPAEKEAETTEPNNGNNNLLGGAERNNAPILGGPQPEENNNVLRAYNNFMDENDRRAFNAQPQIPAQPQMPADNGPTLGDKIMNQVKEDLFSQMADIEKQTSLLTLELKREKIKNEIAAMQAQRQKAIDEELEKQREKERKQAEWEKEQERKLLEDQQKLKEMEMKYEKLRQERVLKSYKESMLKSSQEWVEYNARLYNKLVKEENAQNELIAQQKEFLAKLNDAVVQAGAAARQAKEKYTKEVANLQTQVAVLKSKLEAEKTAFEESKKTGPNPFALADDDGAPKKKIAEEYAIMEISGKGEALVAKLINKNGGTFMVKPGTILNTGHVIEEITQTYITADRSGIKDYLYFSAGGILDKEPTKPLSAPVSDIRDEKPASATSRVPSLRAGMFVE